MSAGEVGVRVREARAEDLGAVVGLERGVETAPHWEKSVYAAMLRMDADGTIERRLVVAEDAGGLIGFAVGRVLRVGMATPVSYKSNLASGSLARAEAEDGAPGSVTPDGVIEAELESVAVRADARRHGVGRALCEAVMAWARELGAKEMQLEVRVSSVGAMALYAGLGFAVSGRRREYYQHPTEDAVLMGARLR